MTFQAKPMVTFQAKLADQQSQRLNNLEQITGSVGAEIICVKSVGVLRPKTREPYEAELLLVKANWTMPKSVDITPLDKQEPGNHKWYLVFLPKMDLPRPLGLTSIAVYYLAIGKVFDTFEEGFKWFESYKNAGPNEA